MFNTTVKKKNLYYIILSKHVWIALSAKTWEDNPHRVKGSECFKTECRLPNYLRKALPIFCLFIGNSIVFYQPPGLWRHFPGDRLQLHQWNKIHLRMSVSSLPGLISDPLSIATLIYLGKMLMHLAKNKFAIESGFSIRSIAELSCINNVWQSLYNVQQVHAGMCPCKRKGSRKRENVGHLPWEFCRAHPIPTTL